MFWSHRGERCTFDVMIEEFGIGTDALLRLAMIVRGADTARLDLAPEAAGLLAASLGLSRMYADDLEQLEAGMSLYDAFYRWCRDATDETHNWPTNKQRRAMQESTKRGEPTHGISFAEATRVWLRVALLSFGGPAGQIAVMHRILVEEKKWISESRFLHALNYCMLLPGPEAQQLATYIGWLLHRTARRSRRRHAVRAAGLRRDPRAQRRSTPASGSSTLVQALFFGLKAAVLAIVVEAVIRIGKRALKNGAMVALAAAAFVAIFFLDVPFPARRASAPA